MGSSLAPILSNIFIGCLERAVIKKLMKSGDVISWTRFADDNLAIIKRGSYEKMSPKLTSRIKIFFTLLKN